ncbi:alpha/beta fold hydrolase [Fulvimarina sp. 2208YS6-2-32]|uniref:Alpha/beta fold hydrolase n=1 Tax=Fulvimarina uroteuthidis TaxID=3098149 RepID=A0ABU5I5K8_9HYPH|nr:alpha/beta fold hydrolase [Fulvimarina sp. 2208YS6-2-32]MDY8110094.1 alpha/beta fold hydrolase [Fulvimarina sp. 2208YS6-2-32]
MSESRAVGFTSRDGHALSGRLEVPSGTPVAFAVFCACFTCGKDFLASVKICRALAAAGIATLRFDFSGLGQSEGDFEHSNFSTDVADTIAAAGFLRDHYEAPKLLVGHSLGGAVAIAAANQIPECVALATIAAPYDAAHVTENFRNALAAIKRDGSAEVELGGRTFMIASKFVEDLTDQPQADRIADLDAALLVMHSPTDEIVGIENARLIHDGARHSKSYVSLEGATHHLTEGDDADYAARMIAVWVSRYIRQPAEAASLTLPSPGP